MYVVVAAPLNRPEVRQFLEPVASGAPSRGATVEIIDQRPTPGALHTWTRKLQALTPETGRDAIIRHLLSIDSPHAHLRPQATDRLVPAQFLKEPGFLTRNLGGWAPIYFAVMGVDDLATLGDDADDPLLRHAETLATYGENIAMFGADPEQVRERLPEEADAGLTTIVEGLVRLDALDRSADSPAAQVPRLVAAMDGAEPLTTASGAPVPEPLLCDALLDRMVRVEQARRAADARGDAETVAEYAVLQRTWADELDVQLILKGEYIAGRHRRSTICLAPSLGLVIKQPGPEPFHDIHLGARTHDGAPENWPTLEKNGAVVTSRGRVRIVMEENVVPLLHAAVDHGVRFSTLLGLIIEDHVPGPTLQAFISEDPRRLTEEVYTRVLTTQQVCEALGVNNPDWHSANFIVEDGTGDLVHIDWGAARPLTPHEQTPDDEVQRVEQVRNFAYSFQDDALADRCATLHDTITSDPVRMADIRVQAERIADRVMSDEL